MTVFKYWINWDGSGTFSAGDEITDYVHEAEWVLGTRESFSSMANESTASLALINTDGRFTPSNPSSPYFGNIKPYRLVKIEAVHGMTTITVWMGYLDLPNMQWKPMGEYTGKHIISFKCVGIKQLIERVEVNLGLYTNVTGDEIVTDVLTETVPVATTDIETGATPFALYGDNSGNGWRVIQDVTEGERGFFWMDRDNTLRWWNRHHKIQNTTITATLDGTTAQDYGLVDADYEYGDNLANVVRVTITPRRIESSQTLWQLDARMTIQAGATDIIEVRLRRDSGQFVASSSLSATPTWASGAAAITVDELGGVARVTITNSGTGAAVLSGLTLTGVPTQAQNSITVEEKNQTSINEIGKREWRLSLGVGGGVDDARQIALYELSRRYELRNTVKAVTFFEVPHDDESVVFSWMMGKRYRITIDTLFIDEDYWCVGERHTWRKGNEHKMTCYLESSQLTKFWLLGVTGLSKLGVTTRLIY